MTTSEFQKSNAEGLAREKRSSLRLTDSERNHLLTLIEVNEQDGWYLAPREQYEARAKRIRQKILANGQIQP